MKKIKIPNLKRRLELVRMVVRDMTSEQLDQAGGGAPEGASRTRCLR